MSSMQKAMERAIVATIKQIHHEEQTREIAGKHFAEHPECQELLVTLEEMRPVTVYVVRQMQFQREGPDLELKEWTFSSFSARWVWQRDEGWKYPAWSLWESERKEVKPVEVARILVKREE